MTYGDRGMVRYRRALFTVLLALLLWGGAAREYSLHKERYFGELLQEGTPGESMGTLWRRPFQNVKKP